MKPITKFSLAIAVAAILFSFISLPKNETKSSPPNVALKIKCCFKVVLPKIKFKRPKKDCKSGFGLCTTDPYICFLCNLDGTTPDCSKCSASKTINADEVELSGSIENDIVTLQLPASIISSPEFKGEDLSTFYIDEPVNLFDQNTKELRATLKPGAYTVNTDYYQGQKTLLKVAVPL